MQIKIRFAILTFAIAAVVTGLSPIVLNENIQVASAQSGYPPQGQTQHPPQANGPQNFGNDFPPGPPDFINNDFPPGPPDFINNDFPSGPPEELEDTPYGQYLSDPNNNFVGQGGELNKLIQQYLQTNDRLVGGIKANDQTFDGDFRDEVVSPP